MSRRLQFQTGASGGIVIGHGSAGDTGTRIICAEDGTVCCCSSAGSSGGGGSSGAGFDPSGPGPCREPDCNCKSCSFPLHSISTYKFTLISGPGEDVGYDVVTTITGSGYGNCSFIYSVNGHFEATLTYRDSGATFNNSGDNVLVTYYRDCATGIWFVFIGDGNGLAALGNFAFLPEGCNPQNPEQIDPGNVAFFSATYSPASNPVLICCYADDGSVIPCPDDGGSGGSGGSGSGGSGGGPPPPPSGSGSGSGGSTSGSGGSGGSSSGGPPLPPLPGIPCTGNFAAFIANDAATQGNWIGVYGSLGYSMWEVEADPPVNSLPAGLTVAWVSGVTHDFVEDDANVRQLLAPGGTSGRRGVVYYNNSEGTTGTWYLQISTTNSVRIAVYACDFDGSRQANSSVQTMTLLSGIGDDSNAGSLTVLDTQSISDYQDGVWLTWDICGDVTLMLHGSVINAVLSGVFFDVGVPATLCPSSTSSCCDYSITLSGGTDIDAVYVFKRNILSGYWLGPPLVSGKRSSIVCDGKSWTMIIYGGFGGTLIFTAPISACPPVTGWVPVFSDVSGDPVLAVTTIDCPGGGSSGASASTSIAVSGSDSGEGGEGGGGCTATPPACNQTAITLQVNLAAPPGPIFSGTLSYSWTAASFIASSTAPFCRWTFTVPVLHGLTTFDATFTLALSALPGLGLWVIYASLPDETGTLQTIIFSVLCANSPILPFGSFTYSDGSTVFNSCAPTVCPSGLAGGYSLDLKAQGSPLLGPTSGDFYTWPDQTVSLTSSGDCEWSGTITATLIGTGTVSATIRVKNTVGRSSGGAAELNAWTVDFIYGSDEATGVERFCSLVTPVGTYSHGSVVS